MRSTRTSASAYTGTARTETIGPGGSVFWRLRGLRLEGLEPVLEQVANRGAALLAGRLGVRVDLLGELLVEREGDLHGEGGYAGELAATRVAAFGSHVTNLVDL